MMRERLVRVVFTLLLSLATTTPKYTIAKWVMESFIVNRMLSYLPSEGNAWFSDVRVCLGRETQKIW